MNDKMVEEAKEKKKKERVSPYRLNLVPDVEARRPEWNLIFISNIPIAVDFYHTAMLEKVITIREMTEALKEQVDAGKGGSD